MIKYPTTKISKANKRQKQTGTTQKANIKAFNKVIQ